MPTIRMNEGIKAYGSLWSHLTHLFSCNRCRGPPIQFKFELNRQSFAKHALDVLAHGVFWVALDAMIRKDSQLPQRRNPRTSAGWVSLGTIQTQWTFSCIWFRSVCRPPLPRYLSLDPLCPLRTDSHSRSVPCTRRTPYAYLCNSISHKPSALAGISLSSSLETSEYPPQRRPAHSHCSKNLDDTSLPSHSRLAWFVMHLLISRSQGFGKGPCHSIHGRREMWTSELGYEKISEVYGRAEGAVSGDRISEIITYCLDYYKLNKSSLINQNVWIDQSNTRQIWYELYESILGSGWCSD